MAFPSAVALNRSENIGSFPFLDMMGSLLLVWFMFSEMHTICPVLEIGNFPRWEW